jgi:hypothetical protein
LEVFGADNPNIILRGNPTYLQIGIPSANGNYASFAKHGDVVFRPMSGPDGHVGIIFTIPTNTGTGTSYFKFGDEKNGGWFSLYNNKVATIDGKVGIGVENPVQALEVNGTIKATSLSLTNGQLTSGATNLSLQTNGDNRMTILNSNGYVGIGTTAPSALLDVNGTAKAASLSLTNGQLTSGATNLFLQTNGANRMTILNSNGYIGVGTTAPSVPLEVNGAAKAASLNVGSRLGIGGDQPTCNLDILDKTPNTTKAVLARLAEGGESYLGVKAYDTQLVYSKMFAIEHKFYGNVNNAINFYRGGSQIGGWITVDVYNGITISKFSQRGLDVYGIIQGKEIRASETGWADFVFKEGYNLPTLNELKQHIDENKHLPGIPTEAEVKENGVNLGEMQVKLLQKIEELTLYVIQQQETIDELKGKMEKLENK